ncbi:DUF4125 family protein [Eubacteriaceae bacterium ES3]|nr:DUF4125 family protein [Eubacteriaceae bacterium ES3]
MSSKSADLIKEILKIEWEMFQKVSNTGGRASCQDNLRTFEIMRSSQFKAWSVELQESYLEDLKAAEKGERNLLTEKYAMMMKYTHPAEYEKIKSHLPIISPEKERLIEQIAQLYKEQDRIFSENYPKLKARGRSTDLSRNATVEVYFEGEISTYSEKTLALFLGYLEELNEKGENISIKINANIARAYGYPSIDEAEMQLV